MTQTLCKCQTCLIQFYKLVVNFTSRICEYKNMQNRKRKQNKNMQ